MASTKTLNATNLETLGAVRLAALLIEVSTGDAGIKRRLRLALAGEASAANAADAILKRLTTIMRSRARLDWRKVKPLATDLTAQHSAIVDLVAPTDPRAALDLLWRFAACANSVFDRTQDGSGRLNEVFAAALIDLAPIAEAARADPHKLADRAFDALDDDEHGVLDDLVTILAPALGTAGLEHLRALARAAEAEPAPVVPDSERRVFGWGLNGPLYADDSAYRRRRMSHLLGQIADALGDVDSYIAQYDAKTRCVPAIAARIADRLLAAGRLDDAWTAIEAAAGTDPRYPAEDWERTRIAVLEALGRQDEAQAFRWDRFVATLDADHLRAHLRRLPDFDDFEAEQRAIAHARVFPGVLQALLFLVEWPALDAAATLVRTRASEIDGNLYEILTPAAETLETKYPLAATILRRAMIDFTLTRARHSRYVHAARNLSDAARLASRIDDFGDVPTHDDYVAHLRTTHPRKPGFWGLVDGG